MYPHMQLSSHTDWDRELQLVIEGRASVESMPSPVSQTKTSTIQSHGSRWKRATSYVENLGIITLVDHSERATHIVAVQIDAGP